MAPAATDGIFSRQLSMNVIVCGLLGTRHLCNIRKRGNTKNTENRAAVTVQMLGNSQTMTFIHKWRRPPLAVDGMILIF